MLALPSTHTTLSFQIAAWTCVQFDLCASFAPLTDHNLHAFLDTGHARALGYIVQVLFFVFHWARVRSNGRCRAVVQPRAAVYFGLPSAYDHAPSMTQQANARGSECGNGTLCVRVV